MSRRNVMVGSLAAAGATFLAPASAHAFGGGWFRRKPNKAPLVDFEPLTAAEAVAKGNNGQMITVSSDYEYQSLIPWGTPLKKGVPEYTGTVERPKSSDAEHQIGIGHDGMWFYPGNLPRILRWETRRGRELPAHLRNKLLWNRYGMLCVNHEFGTNPHVLGKPTPTSLEDVRLSQAVHGVSVVAIYQTRGGHWKVVPSNKNRRITVNTEMHVSGPAADSPLLQEGAGEKVLGTLNNCGSGNTPWGTYVTCEENFNGYFGSTTGSIGGFDEKQDEAYSRYGFSTGGFGYGWHLFDDRFDLSKEEFRNESNRFGWCVEIDPFDPDKKPVKRTAMGRFKHEAVAFKELKDGRVAVYMGDDQRGDYCYKYESNRPWRHYSFKGSDHPLDDGKLYVAVFGGAEDLADGNGRGRGEWVELTADNPDIHAAGLTTQDQVLVYTRLAADAVGATKMDRPEWTTIGTKGEVYWTLTNNDRKDTVAPKDGEVVVNEVNPILNHKDGHIIRTDDISSTKFKWRVFILARNTRPEDPGTGPNLQDGDGNDILDANGDPIRVDYTYADYEAPGDGGVNTFTDPDAAWADPYGRLFIGTDGGQPKVGDAQLQDQLVVFDVKTGEYRRLLMGVQSDEITGITTTPDYRTMFTNTQHPGDGDPTATNFPAPFDGVTIPRDCTIVLRRKDGGIVGS